jgi:site-specific recombinase XerD
VYRFYGKGKGDIEDYAEMPEMAVQAIFRYLSLSGRLSTIKAEDPLWIAERPLQGGGRLNQGLDSLHGQSILELFKHYASLAGIPLSRACVHSLRHTSAQQRRAAGESIESISRILRHSSISVTVVYLNAITTTEDPGAMALSVPRSNTWPYH